MHLYIKCRVDLSSLLLCTYFLNCDSIMSIVLFYYLCKAGQRTTQKEVMMELSSVTRPLMALLMSILEVSCSPHEISRDALFSPIHSSGQPGHKVNKASAL